MEKLYIDKNLKIAVRRLLTEEEFKSLDKKQRYFNPNKGLRGKSVR